MKHEFEKCDCKQQTVFEIEHKQFMNFLPLFAVKTCQFSENIICSCFSSDIRLKFSWNLRLKFSFFLVINLKTSANHFPQNLEVNWIEFRFLDILSVDFRSKLVVIDINKSRKLTNYLKLSTKNSLRLIQIFIISILPLAPTSQQFAKLRPLQRKARHSKRSRVCVRCPQLITAVANEGLDGILMVPPKARSCKTNLPFARKLFQIETLFGPEMSFILPQGRHRIQAKIRNVETGMIVHSCVLKYNVIVRRCDGFPNVKNKNLTVSCTAGNLWGSKCAFRCKNDDEYLSHRKPMVCNDKLEWAGNEPQCTPNHGNYFDLIQGENIFQKKNKSQVKIIYQNCLCLIHR